MSIPAFFIEDPETLNKVFLKYSNGEKIKEGDLITIESKLVPDNHIFIVSIWEDRFVFCSTEDPQLRLRIDLFYNKNISFKGSLYKAYIPINYTTENYRAQVEERLESSTFYFQENFKLNT